jgi:hypothetical protein
MNQINNGQAGRKEPVIFFHGNQLIVNGFFRKFWPEFTKQD